MPHAPRVLWPLRRRLARRGRRRSAARPRSRLHRLPAAQLPGPPGCRLGLARAGSATSQGSTESARIVRSARHGLGDSLGRALEELERGAGSPFGERDATKSRCSTSARTADASRVWRPPPVAAAAASFRPAALHAARRCQEPSRPCRRSGVRRARCSCARAAACQLRPSARAADGLESGGDGFVRSRGGQCPVPCPAVG